MYLFLICISISLTWAGILPKSRHPLRHGYRSAFLLGQIKLRDPSLEQDNFVLRKSVPIKNTATDLFGKDGILYLSRPKLKNNLLEKVRKQMALQYLREADQESRSLEAKSFSDFRRYGDKVKMPKLVYEFNELVV